MDKNFPLNRFDFSNLIEYIQKIEVLPNVISDSETGIEFYVGNTITKEAFVCFLDNFNVIDNLAQNDNKQEYEKQTLFEVKNFQFEPSWVEIISPVKVTVGYVGIYVNSNFDLTFLKINDVWTLVK